MTVTPTFRLNCERCFGRGYVNTIIGHLHCPECSAATAQVADEKDRRIAELEAKLRQACDDRAELQACLHMTVGDDSPAAAAAPAAGQWTDERIAEVIRRAGILCVHPEAKTTLDIARTILAAAAPGAVPAGWKLVPVEPTKEMIDATRGFPWVNMDMPPHVAYPRMLAVAPVPAIGLATQALQDK